MTHTTINNKNINDVFDSIEVFLFCPLSGKKRKIKNDLSSRLDALNAIEMLLENSIAFISLEKALAYSKFMDNHHLLVRAFVPEKTIIGHSYGLTIKKGVLTKNTIHGYYPGDTNGLLYVKNPDFEMGFFPRSEAV